MGNKNNMAFEQKNVSFSIGSIILLFSLILPATQFYLIYDGDYVFYRQVEIFTRTNSEFVPLLFPIIMAIICLICFKGSKKGISIPETNSEFVHLVKSKLKANVFLSFLTAFSIVFLSFIFVIYIVPLLDIVTISPNNYGNPLPLTTFEQFLSLGTLPYGIIYSVWVGLNGVLYATFGLLLLLIYRNSMLSLLIPVFFYLSHFFAELFGYFQFSPLHSIFPFGIAQQPLWTVLIPFITLSFIVLFLFNKLMRKNRMG